MAFSPPVVGCLVKKGLQKGGHGHPRTPMSMPLQSRVILHLLKLRGNYNTDLSTPKDQKPRDHDKKKTLDIWQRTRRFINGVKKN